MDKRDIQVIELGSSLLDLPDLVRIIIGNGAALLGEQGEYRHEYHDRNGAGFVGRLVCG